MSSGEFGLISISVREHPSRFPTEFTSDTLVKAETLHVRRAVGNTPCNTHKRHHVTVEIIAVFWIKVFSFERSLANGNGSPRRGGA